RREAKAPGEPRQWIRFVRNSVGLLFGFDLQAVLNAAEEAIRIIQRQNFIVREQIQFSQCAERLEHTRFLQKRITRAMDKLQRLHDELDVANAAASKFYVALQLFRPNYVALDAVLDVRNLLEQIRRCTFRVDEWLMQPQEIVSQLAAAGDSARLDERNPLPRFAEPRVIVFHALERPSQRACRAFGAHP